MNAVGTSRAFAQVMDNRMHSELTDSPTLHAQPRDTLEDLRAPEVEDDDEQRPTIPLVDEDLLDEQLSPLTPPTPPPE